MKPAPFRYAAPDTVAEALGLLRSYGQDGKLLAGGQSLVPLLNMRLARPSVIIDLNRILELSYIKEDNGEIAVGAMTRQREAELSPLIRRRLPLLAEALGVVGHPQIRNRGTIGGSIAHADPSAELPAVAAALEAKMVIRDPKGRRVLTPDEFFLSYLTTALEPDELLVEVRFPVIPKAGAAFLEVARRHGDYALAGVAVVVSKNGEQVGTCRLAFTGVGPGPVRIPEAEAAVTGNRLTDRVLQDVRKTVEERLDPDSDVHASAEYRKHVAGVLTVRALRFAAERAGAR
ncbi:MAG: xanthine dehydrogenase family protein subunit M [Armatimonadetes bacterium]|nr:xanthine dehydrogenase family protein subunit M [Armatimonadota bacterium]